MDKALLGSLLFMLGSIIFTIDGTRLVVTHGIQSTLYLVGSVVFLLGCYIKLKAEVFAMKQKQGGVVMAGG
jgi:hypothetical protein